MVGFVGDEVNFAQKPVGGGFRLVLQWKEGRLTFSRGV